MTDEKPSEAALTEARRWIAKQGGLARARNMTAEERSASSAKAAKARIKKYGQKRRKPRLA